jgi:hypothetical protein
MTAADRVVHCAECGAPSTGDLAGRDRWQVLRRSALCAVDVCPACIEDFARPQRPGLHKSNGPSRCDCFSREAPRRAGAGLAIDPCPPTYHSEAQVTMAPFIGGWLLELNRALAAYDAGWADLQANPQSCSLHRAHPRIDAARERVRALLTQRDRITAACAAESQDQ